MAETSPTSYDAESGFAVIEHFLSADDVAAVLSSCVELMALPPGQRHSRDKVAHGTRHLEALDERSAVVADIATRPELLDQVEAIVGRSFLAQVTSYRSPQPGYGEQQLHTDDVPKLDAGLDRVATAIVALVDFTASNGATRLVPGSHRRPDLQREAGSLESHPAETSFLCAAGSVLVFSGHLLHSGTKNNSTTERPALQLTWRRI